MRIGSVMICLVAAEMFVFAGIANAGTILTGSESLNPVPGLFTYAYTLNNTSGTATVTELSILIDSAMQNPSLAPTAHTDPPGTSFDIALSGSSALPPLNEFGTFWQWQVSVPVGTVLSGFSFTTSYAPALNSENNYFLYSNVPETVVEYGNVIAPDVATPEPGTCGLIVFTLTLLASDRKIRMTRTRIAGARHATQSLVPLEI